MKKPLIDYLLFAARTFLVLTFVVHLAVVVVGYYILPDHIVSRAPPDYEIGLRNPYSKEFFLGFMTGLAMFTFLVGIFEPFLSSRNRKSAEPAKYWDRDENIALRGKITDLWMVSCMASFIAYWTVLLLRHFSVNLVTPPRGEAYDPVFDMQIVCIVIPSINWLLCPLTLAIVKWFRERKDSHEILHNISEEGILTRRH